MFGLDLTPSYFDKKSHIAIQKTLEALFIAMVKKGYFTDDECAEFFEAGVKAMEEFDEEEKRKAEEYMKKK